jgi:tripartite-type tricarboxylate transporter receptor subunit TctC
VSTGHERLSIGQMGPHTLHALAVTLVERHLGTRFVEVPYNGATPLLRDLQGGHVDLAVVVEPAARPLVQQQRVGLVAKLSSAAGFRTESWSGWFVAEGTPRADVDALAAAVVDTLQNAQTARALADLGSVAPLAEDQRRFADEVRTDVQRYREIARLRAAASADLNPSDHRAASEPSR